MRPILGADEIRKMDQQTIQERGISSFHLMQEVAEAMARRIIRSDSRQGVERRQFLLLCGPGNNGGDAYGVAELLRQSGAFVRVFPVLPPQSPDCKKSSDICQADRLESLDDILSADFELVDGVFGLGSRADFPPGLESLFKTLSSRKFRKVWAVDLPSGMNSETGEHHSLCLSADETLSVAVGKKAFLNKEALEKCGRIYWVDADFRGEKTSEAQVIEASDFSLFRKESQHKTGRVNVFAGSAKSPGAAFLTAEAAQRMGAGYVRLYFSDRESPPIELRHASFQFHPKWNWKSVEKADVHVFGPGAVPKSFEKKIFGGSGNSLLSDNFVFDADALTPSLLQALATRKADGDKSFALLTPHPGEAARLLETDLELILAEPLEAAREIVERSGAVVYLKTQPAYLVFPEQKIYYVNLSICSGLGTAGSGDVLSGIFGGLIALSHAAMKDPQADSLDERRRRALLSALAFQMAIAERMRGQDAWISSDQLSLFQEAFQKLKEARA